MRMLDICCGRGGWTNAFLDRGWEVWGVDIIRRPEYRGLFLLRDVMQMTAYSLERFDFACASTPCENFSLFQIRNFHPDPPYPELGVRLFNHTRAILEESGIPHVMENVRAAQQFVGPAVHHCGSFFLWGNAVPPLIPKGLTKGMKMDRAWCQNLGGHGTKQRDEQTAGFAGIPPELANCVADYAGRLLEVKA